MRQVPFHEIPVILTEVSSRSGNTIEAWSESLFGSYFTDYTGRRFDELVRTTDPLRFEPADLVAINMLSVRLHPMGIDTLLFDEDFGAECRSLLQEIPVNVPLWELPADELQDGAPGPRLWALIKSRVKGTKQGITVISKLLAAKRPHLFPVWDTQVDGLVERPDGKLWEPMHELLRDASVRTALERLTAGAPPHVTLLRRIDVALWQEASRRSHGDEEALQDG